MAATSSSGAHRKRVDGQPESGLRPHQRFTAASGGEQCHFERASGVLCHPTSFPSRFGIGDLGKGAWDFVDWLADAKQQLWQVLPLGPTGYGDSPYQCFSAFAGNPMLISPEGLAYSGPAPAHGAPDDAPYFPADRVDFGPVIEYKQGMLRQAYAHFKSHGTDAQRDRPRVVQGAEAGLAA